MNNSELIYKILFDWMEMDSTTLKSYCNQLSPKLLRWLGAHHPDNKTRLIFFEMTIIQIGEGTVINANFIVSDNYEPLLFIGKRVAISPNVTAICASGPNNSILKNEPYVREKL